MHSIIDHLSTQRQGSVQTKKESLQISIREIIAERTQKSRDTQRSKKMSIINNDKHNINDRSIKHGIRIKNDRTAKNDLLTSIDRPIKIEMHITRHFQ